MESVNRRTGLLICIVLAILSVVIFAGIFFAIVEKRESSGKRTRTDCIPKHIEGTTQTDTQRGEVTGRP